MTDDLDALRAELRTAYAELAAVREREQTYRNAWRIAARERSALRLDRDALRALVKRKARVAEIGFKWLRESRRERDRLRALVSRLQARRADADEYIAELKGAANG